MRDINWYKESLILLNIRYNILLRNINVDIREAHNINEEIRKQEDELKRLIKIFNNDQK